MTESSPLVLKIDPTLTFKENASGVLKVLRVVDDPLKYRYLHEVSEEGFNEIWFLVEDVFKREGLGRPSIEKMKHHLIFEWWNQVLSDLFGEHVTVERQ